ncbi:DNA repair protein endonuclease SAE2/CtIP C-terminus-domain-containing protein [Suillus clintonianus]|uniref:DNA repair protein endonuclease SAE2/CtIP C-terminus-domain-containing protein n=1 Tax=Suillus clintonianus TaxID=1904413 RepID=UPI001B86A207|nr:DNA repair protein endonuclease SAE2/CtIP C-terminus-domain-containing protein [Suillus clintonianus]KAG2149266.1 DNA repair protein endonuclease SAE2/CtIP C-terminus-domain-containing protein [Suillus clintonianus]
MSASNTNDTSTLLLKISSLQLELSHLQHRYDALLATKERAATRYKADYKKWRSFKHWLCESSDCDKGLHPLLKDTNYDAYRRVSGIDKRRKFDEIGPDLCAFDNSEEHIESKTLPDALDKQQEVSSTVYATRGETVSAKVEEQPATAIKLPLHGHSIGKDILNEDISAGTSVLQSNNSCRDLHKRRGRYAQATDATTINSRFTICEERNHGVNYQYDEVVKSRDERKKMLADDCECCRGYYEAVGQLPKPLQQPLWRSPSSTPTKKRRFSFDSLSDRKENCEDIEHHKKRISRHRHHWYRAKTPPGYWDIGFPDTQETSDINRRAAEMYAQKLGEVESEVRSGKGRYVKRII